MRPKKEIPVKKVRRGLRSSLCVLALATALVPSVTSAAAGQGVMSVPPASAPTTAPESAPPDNDTSHCQAIAAGNPEMTPLVGLCRFALTFRRQLPDFICEQTTTSTGRQPAKTMNAEVTVERGHERYSNVTIDGKAPTEEAVRAMKFISTGELGSDLVDLFKAPLPPNSSFAERKGSTKLAHRCTNSTLPRKRILSGRCEIVAELPCTPSIRVSCGWTGKAGGFSG